MKYKVIAKRKKPSTIHAIGFCRGCKKQFDVFHDGMRKIRSHVLKTGHSVDVEYGSYNTFFRVEK